MTIRAVTFDLDETLWATRAVLERAEKTSYSWMCEQLPGLSTRFNMGGLLSQRRQHYAQHPQRMHDFTWLRQDWMRSLGEEFGGSPDFAQRAFEHWWALRNQVRLFDGVEPMLLELRKRVRVGAITNGNADVGQVGAAHLFDFVITAGDAGAAKPEPRIFDLALEQAGCTADETVHVGDDPECDVRGAMALGMFGVWINPALTPWPGGANPSAVLRHVNELPQALERIEAVKRKKA